VVEAFFVLLDLCVLGRTVSSSHGYWVGPLVAVMAIGSDR